MCGGPGGPRNLSPGGVRCRRCRPLSRGSMGSSGSGPRGPKPMPGGKSGGLPPPPPLGRPRLGLPLALRMEGALVLVLVSTGRRHPQRRRTGLCTAAPGLRQSARAALLVIGNSPAPRHCAAERSAALRHCRSPRSCCRRGLASPMPDPRATPALIWAMAGSRDCGERSRGCKQPAPCKASEQRCQHSV